MQSHDWIRTCAEVFGLGGDLEIVVAGGFPHPAIAQLFRSKGHGGRLRLIDATHGAEATDFLYSDPSQVDSLAAAISRSRLPLRLDRMLADSPVPSALAGAYRGRGIVISRPTVGYPWIPLDQTWEDPTQRLSRHRRSNLRRAWRIAKEMGAVSCEVLSPSPKELESALREAYAVEAAGWKGKEKTALAADPSLGEFYRRYAAIASARGILRLCFLRIDGRAAAMQIAVETGQRFWLLKIGYSQEFARCSPGVLLISETIRYAARAGLRSYEFLGVDEPWIHIWGPLVRPCVSIRAYPVSLRGAMAIVTDLATMTPAEAKAILRRGR